MFRVLIVAWATAIMTGSLFLGHFTASPGQASAVPVAWPEESTLEPAEIVLFVHPNCPCSQATMRQLERVLARVPRLPKLLVVAYQPSSQSPEWYQTDLVRALEKLAGRPASVDVGGREARRFGATTSGHLLAFDSVGQLCFSGGITAGRGHEGDNPGQLALLDLIAGEALPGPHRYPVYGCPLLPAESESDL